MQSIEKILEDAFKNVPPLPEEARKGLAQAMPWLTLVGGVLSLLTAWYLYQAVAWVDQWAGYANSITGYTAPVAGVGVVAWLGLAVLAAQAVLFLVAFPALRSFRKSGWNLLLWAALASIVYAIISNLFSGYLNLGGLLMSLLGSAIGLYLLFQVRSFFGGATSTAKPAAKADKK